MPSLTAKSLAELLRLPAYQQARILTEQKYPKQAPQSFRTPYYQPAVTGIRRYFQSGNNAATIASAKAAIQNLASGTRRTNNGRVLEAFEKSAARSWPLNLEPNKRVLAQLHGIEIKLSPDIRAAEHGDDVVLFMNCRGVTLDPEIATLTLEIAHWVLEQNGLPVKTPGLRYLDLFTDKTYRIKSRRSSTLKAVNQSAKVIAAIWPSL